jgi:hypothetical protein
VNLPRIPALDQINLDRSSKRDLALCAFCESAHTPCDTGRQSESIHRIARNGHRKRLTRKRATNQTEDCATRDVSFDCARCDCRMRRYEWRDRRQRWKSAGRAKLLPFDLHHRRGGPRDPHRPLLRARSPLRRRRLGRPDVLCDGNLRGSGHRRPPHFQVPTDCLGPTLVGFTTRFAVEPSG